jgi:hypothetical protein
MGMRSKVRKEAERDAKRLVEVDFSRSGFAVEPVGIANRLGVEVYEARFDEGILGGLFMKAGGDLVGGVAIVTRHLFPARDGGEVSV